MTGLVVTRRAVLGAAAWSAPAAVVGSRAAFAAPALRLADPHASRSAKDLAILLDGFTAGRTMAVGQQLNVNGDDPLGPLTALDAEAPALSERVRVLGWTTNEWQYAVRHDYNQEVLGDLIVRAQG